MNKLTEKRLFLLDMDGTIYLDENLFDGVLDFLKYIKDIGGRYIFITNNSSKSVDKYIDKLSKLGIASTKDDFFTSVDATVLKLKKCTYKKLYALGTASFKKQLTDAGFPVTDKLEDGIDCLLMGFDTEITFRKLEDACILLNRGVDYIATNPDLVCPTYYGYVPDCGSVAEMLFNATKRRPYFIGKPQPDMINEAMRITGFGKDETVVIGDRLYTDIASGINAGVDQIFVLSGEGTVEDIDKFNVHPTYIMQNIKELSDILKRD